MADKWLAPGDRLILDDADHAVVEVTLARTDRGSVQVLRVTPELGGEPRWLLQLEDEAVLEAEETDAAALGEAEAVIGGERFERQWSGEARTERSVAGERTHFGRGPAELHRSASGAVALVISDQRAATAFVGRPLEPARLDLRFT